MIDALILRLDAPLISFGGVMIDQNGVSRQYPARSMLTGLIANALGFNHRDADLLQALQSRIHHGVRCDVPGELLHDYQTVDLSQDFMREGWTTRGKVQRRDGGTAKTGTHIRYRDYLADAVYGRDNPRSA